MAKAINWPQEFKNEVINEAEDSIKIAIRPGRLYHDTKYYHKGEIVHIRIDNTIIRTAVIQEEMKVCKIKDISKVDLNLLKNSLQSTESIKNFLSKRYNICIDENTEVTIITYRNLGLTDEALQDDPHFN